MAFTSPEIELLVVEEEIRRPAPPELPAVVITISTDPPRRAFVRQPVVIKGDVMRWGKPVAGVNVLIYVNDVHVATVVTNGAGRYWYTMSFDRPGLYRIRAVVTGLGSSHQAEAAIEVVSTRRLLPILGAISGILAACGAAEALRRASGK